MCLQHLACMQEGQTSILSISVCQRPFLTLGARQMLLGYALPNPQEQHPYDWMCMICCGCCRYKTSVEEDRGLVSTVAPGSRKHKAILVRYPAALQHHP